MDSFFKPQTVDDMFEYTSEGNIVKENISLKRLSTTITEEIKRQKRLLTEKEIATLNKASATINKLIQTRESALSRKRNKIKAIEVNVERFKSAIRKHYGQISELTMLKYVIGRSVRSSVYSRGDIIKEFEWTIEDVVKSKMKSGKTFKPDETVVEYDALFENTSAQGYDGFIAAVEEISSRLNILK